MVLKKKRVLVLFGGKSGEHEVSIVSAKSVYNALDRTKYDVILVGIDKQGRWLLPDETRLLAQSSNPRLVNLQGTSDAVGMLPYDTQGTLMSVTPFNVSDSKHGFHFDVVLPILHGPNGEDGTIQGLLELASVPYVGSGVLGSALCMDKDVAKRVLRDAGIPVVPFVAVRRAHFEKDEASVVSAAAEQFGYPYFVKPANMGSSVGVAKVKNDKEAFEKLKMAFEFDTKILIEKAVEARELECAVLGNDQPRASVVGEIVPNGEFYSYESKYVDENGAELFIPAPNLSPEEHRSIQELSLHAFKALECSGMARVDFFQDKNSGALYLNELNTIPGFTPVSMYPKLWEASGLPYADLISCLIELACERHEDRKRNRT
jgi:D-alanine-D-alanine ligase